MKRLPLALLFCFSIFPHSRAATESALPRSTPEAEGVDSAGVLSFVDTLEKKIDAVHSIMIVRHGKVVAEGWWTPYAAGDVHIIYSATKSFTSTAIAFAAQEGLLNINDKVLSFFPDLAPTVPAAQLKAMRIRDLLAMSSGHQKDTIDRLRTHTDGQWRRAFLALDVENKPGTHFVYNSGNSYMLSAIVQKVTGQTLDAFLEPRLFEPLGIKAHPWGLSDEGIALGDGGLSITTESLAKFGLLYLQKGMWNGRQLLAEKWVEQASARQSSNGGDPDSDWDAGYGFQFWRNKTTGYRADGALGQFSFILPEYDTVVAVTGGTSDLKGLMNIVWEQLLPALHYVALPANATAQAALSQKLASLTLPVQPGSVQSPRANEISGRSYAFPENEQGLASAEIDFSGKDPVIVFKDTDGRHSIPCGVGRWIRGSTHFRKRISSLWDVTSQGIAATGAWTDDNTFVAKICFVETPYTITAHFKFEGEKLLLDMQHNQRWGEKIRPRLTGQRVATP